MHIGSTHILAYITTVAMFVMQLQQLRSRQLWHMWSMASVMVGVGVIVIKLSLSKFV